MSKKTKQGKPIKMYAVWDLGTKEAACYFHYRSQAVEEMKSQQKFAGCPPYIVISGTFIPNLPTNE